LVALRSTAARWLPPLSASRPACEDGHRPAGPAYGPRTQMRREDLRTDAQLASDVLAGDTESFAVLVDRHQRRVFNVVYRMVGNRNDAEDLAQEVFCKLFQHLDRYDTSLPLENWLVRIATNHTLNWLERKRIPTEPFDRDKSGRGSAFEPRDPSASPIERAEENEAREIIMRGLQRLPPNLRLVFILKYMEDYTSEEVAELIDVPRNTAKTWIFRARVALRGEVERLLGESPGGMEKRRR
jgi:RNA polymerase sigma-70 factor (ECF subfamily)